MKIKEDVCKNLKDISRDVWNFYGTAKNNGMGIREETFTEMTLVEMIRRIPNTYIHTKTFNSGEENANGSDWEWFIILDNKFVRYRVQAKKLHFDKRKYYELDHKVKKDTKYVDYQWARLVKDAYNSKPQAIPIYSFFNYLTKEELDDFLPKTKKESLLPLPFDHELLGWTFCYAEAVFPVTIFKNKKFVPFYNQTCSKPIYQLICSKDLQMMTDEYNNYVGGGPSSKCTVRFPLVGFNEEEIEKPEIIKPVEISELPQYVVELLPNEYREDNNLEVGQKDIPTLLAETNVNTEFVAVTVFSTSSSNSNNNSKKETISETSYEVKSLRELIIEVVSTLKNVSRTIKNVLNKLFGDKSKY